jgi:hypothetical protein
MHLMSGPDIGLETLLDLGGSILEQEGSYWIKIEVRRVPLSPNAPQGIRYSLTLHDRLGTRVLGYDNAHAVKPPNKFKFAGQRLAFDRRRRTVSDKGVPCAFRTSENMPCPLPNLGVYCARGSGSLHLGGATSPRQVTRAGAAAKASRAG